MSRPPWAHPIWFHAQEKSSRVVFAAVLWIVGISLLFVGSESASAKQACADVPHPATATTAVPSSNWLAIQGAAGTALEQHSESMDRTGLSTPRGGACAGAVTSRNGNSARPSVGQRRKPPHTSDSVSNTATTIPCVVYDGCAGALRANTRGGCANQLRSKASFSGVNGKGLPAPLLATSVTRPVTVLAAGIRFSPCFVAPKTPGWTLPEGGGGANIGGRWFTEHALERMAPRTPQVMAELESRALARAQAAGLKPGTPEFGQWWNKFGPDPRGVPTSVVEAEIANPGSTGVRVITNANGDVVTVIPGVS